MWGKGETVKSAGDKEGKENCYQDANNDDDDKSLI